MDRDDLSKRDNWQADANARGGESEINFSEIFREKFKNSNIYQIDDKPSDLSKIYGRRGIKPDHAIRNLQTERSIYVEIKRQADRGNAHERVCKYFVPSLAKVARKHGNIRECHYPYWIVFTNGLANDPRYEQEIEMWFEGFDNIHIRWKDMTSSTEILDFYNKHIKPRID